MQTSILYFIIGLFIVGFGVLLYLLVQMKKKSEEPYEDPSIKVVLDFMKSLKEGSDSSRREIQDSIQKSNDVLNKRLTEAAKLFGEVQTKVGEMTEVGRGMREIQEMLKGSKLRGGMTEDALEMMLKQVLSDKSYKMQYRFNSGEIVDCVIILGKELLCIDAKFPLENFRQLIKSEKEEDQVKFRKDFLKDIKKHIDAIAKKYILPNEGTMDFAMMYVQMESVFLEIINDPETSDYARTKKIYIASPNSFYYYLTIIHNSLRSTQINEMLKPLIRMISAIKQDSDKFTGNLSTLTKHITNAKNTSDLINEDFRKLASKIENAYSLQLEDNVIEVKKLTE